MPFRFLRTGSLLLPLLLAAFFAYGGSAPESVKLPLKTALALAIHNNLDLRVDALDSSIVESYLQRSKGIYDPYLSMNVDHGETFYTGETYGTKSTTGSVSLTQYLPTGGSITASTYTGYTEPLSDFPDDNWTDWYTSAGITVSQPLLKFLGKETTELNINLAANEYEGSLVAFHESVSETVYSVIKAYNRLYAKGQILEERKSALASAQQLLNSIKEQSKPDSEQDVEIANTEYAISQRMKDLVDAQLNVSDSQAALRYLIGMKEKHDIIPIEPPSKEDAQVTQGQAINLAMENRADLKQLQLDLKSKEMQERVSKRKLLPSLSVNGGVGFRGIEDKFSDSIQQIGDGKGQWWSAGLQFNLPLGNTVAQSDYRLSGLRTKQLQNQIAALEWKIRDDIEEDLRSLLSARIQRHLADEAFEAAKQRLGKYRQSLKRKSSNIQDLLNAENDLIYARNNQTQALEVFSNAVALFWKDVGVLLERKNINIDAEDPEKLTSGTEAISYPVSSPQQLSAIKPVAKASSEPSTGQVQASAPVVAKPIVAVAAKKQLAESEQKSVAKKDQKTKTLPTTKVDSGGSGVLYTLKIGEYASSELAKAKQKLVRAGLKPMVTTGGKQSRQVTRLKVGDYKSQQLAQQQLQKIRKYTAGGFIIHQRKTGYRLYAGSFFSHDSAQKEQQRLVAHGIDLTLEETEVKLPTSLLTAGSFRNREAALAEVQKLKKLGLQAVVQTRG